MFQSEKAIIRNSTEQIDDLSSHTSSGSAGRIVAVTVFFLSGILGLFSPATRIAAAEKKASSTRVPAISPADADFFESRVRPLLVANCLNCHGEKKQEAGLRLDSRAGMLKGGDTGPAVVPGKPKESELIKAIHYDGDYKMPPAGKLPADAIAALTTWVEKGAPWPDGPVVKNSGKANAATHWAYQPIQNPPVPMTKTAGWSRTPIDSFLLAALEEKGLQPSPEADRRTLLRRLHYDLVGLPPTEEEIASFLADRSPDAYEKRVDTLLASPRHGERWGRYWLDIARYADGKGYVFFEEQSYPWAYTYRDYVIESLNADLPYDQFVVEQLAADLLPKRRNEATLRALGFLTVGGRFMNNVHDMLDDRIDVVTRGLMGMTVSCARCHDHKFDPIPTADYYSLYGVMRNSKEPILLPTFAPLPNDEATKKFQTEMAARTKKLDDFVAAKMNELALSVRTRSAEYLLAVHAQRNQPRQDDFMLLVNAGEINPTMINRWRAYLDGTRRSHDPVWAIWNRLFVLKDEEFAAKAPSLIQQTLDDKDPAKSLNPLVREAFAKASPKTMKEVADIYGKLFSAVEARWQVQLKQAATNKQPAPPKMTDSAGEEIRQIFESESGVKVPKMLGWGILSLLPDRPAQAEFQKLIKEMEKWAMTGPGAPPRAMVLNDTEIPYQSRVFLRGNPNRLGPVVERAFLKSIEPNGKPFGAGSGRLDLARSIVAPSNPLTPRVIVNRIWQHHFGQGLVTTPSDFGLRSDPPSHPQLLDYLAAELVRHDWSLKWLHRQIVLSSAYRQRSRVEYDSVSDSGQLASGGENASNSTTGIAPGPQANPPQSGASSSARRAALIDPENRLLWRMNRRRLDFESFRDTLLAAAGPVDQQLGGKSVDVTGGGFQPRRSVYEYIDRLNPQGLLRSFDVPSPEATSPRRDDTTIAPQALYLMNNPFALEVARRLANRGDVASAKETTERILRMYAVLFQRTPTSRELAAAAEFLGPTPKAADWTQFGQALLLTNELIFVD